MCLEREMPEVSASMIVERSAIGGEGEGGAKTAGRGEGAKTGDATGDVEAFVDETLGEGGKLVGRDGKDTGPKGSGFCEKADVEAGSSGAET